jgi:hypothetical protein
MKNYRYFIMGMISFMAVVNYVDRGAISYAQQDIIMAISLVLYLAGFLLIVKDQSLYG